jgi:hypothetical protein
VNDIRIARLKRLAALTACCVLVVHVALSLYLTFSNRLTPLGKSLVARVYHHLIHLGPFFREDAIQISPHFIVAARRDEQWHYTDLMELHVQQYHESPWKTQHLTLRDFVRENARLLVKARNNPQSLAFRKLSHIVREDVDLRGTDSVKWIYINRWYDIKTKQIRPDTLLNLAISGMENE